MSFASFFLSPVDRIKLALEAKDEDLVWQYLKKYSNNLPNDIRRKLWLALSPTSALRCSSIFEEAIRSSPNYRTLTNDMERTWGIEGEEMDGEELESLRNDLRIILVSYWNENARVSYCQGIHSICNMIYHEMNFDMDETLCVLNGVMEELRVGGLYIHEPPLTALQHCGDLILEYLSTADPYLCESIDSLDFVNILAHWFMSGFVGVLSRRVVRFLFDTLICDGIIVFFAAALAILKLRRSDIVSGARDPRTVEGSLLLSLGLGSSDAISRQHEKYFVKLVENIQEQLLINYNFDEKIETPLFHDETDSSSSSSFWASSSTSTLASSSSSSTSEFGVLDAGDVVLTGVKTRNRASSDVSEMSVDAEPLGYLSTRDAVDAVEPIEEEEQSKELKKEKEKEKEKERESVFLPFGWLFQSKPSIRHATLT